MATTYVDYTATALQTDFAFNFEYLEDEHIIVEINGTAQLSSAFSIVTSPAKKVVLNVGATAGDVVRVRRKSQPDTNLVDFVNGSVLTESELDRAYLHNRYLNEEIAELNDASLQIEAGGTDWDARTKKIKNLATPTLTTDATTKDYVDGKVNQAATGASSPPLKWVFTGTAGADTTYTVTGAEINGDTAYDVSSNGSVLEPTTDYTVDPNTDTLTIKTTLTGGEDIVIIQRGFGIPISTGEIGSSQISASAITTAKIADSAVTTAKIGANAVTTAKIADGSVTNAKLATPYVHPNHTGDVTSTGDGVTVIADDAVTSGKISATDANFNVTALGKVGVGKVNSGAYQLEIDGDILVNDTGDNFPAAVFAGSGGAAIQLNDQSANGQIFNLSSNPEGVGGPGAFAVGSIDVNDGTAPTLNITNVTTTTTEATYTFSAAHNIKQGERVQTFGSIDANWNTASLVLSVGSSTTLTVTKPSATTNYPTTAKRVGSFVTFSVRKVYEANVLYNFLKISNLPKATTEPSWLENGQVWIDTTDMSLKIKEYA